MIYLQEIAVAYIILATFISIVGVVFAFTRYPTDVMKELVGSLAVALVMAVVSILILVYICLAPIYVIYELIFRKPFFKP